MNDREIEAKDYDRLRSWYLARLRRAQLHEQDSARLNPSLLIEADSQKSRDLAAKLAAGDLAVKEWSQLVRRVTVGLGCYVMLVGLVVEIWSIAIFVDIDPANHGTRIVAAGGILFFSVFNIICFYRFLLLPFSSAKPQ